MFNIVHGRTDLLTPPDPRVQTFRVNVDFFTDCHSHAKNGFRAKGLLSDIFQD